MSSSDKCKLKSPNNSDDNTALFYHTSHVNPHANSHVNSHSHAIARANDNKEISRNKHEEAWTAFRKRHQQHQWKAADASNASDASGVAGVTGGSASFSYGAYIQNYQRQLFQKQSCSGSSGNRYTSGGGAFAANKQLPPPLSSATYRSKVKKLFPDVDPTVRGRLLLDDVALYSATDQRTSDKMTRAMLEHIPSSSTVINATSSAAGNTFSFARHFARVVAIERNPTRYQHLVHNAEALSVKNVTCLCADALHLLLPHRFRMSSAAGTSTTFAPPTTVTTMSTIRLGSLPLDAVFIDPPWGGPSYRRNPRISLFLSRIPLSTIVKEMAEHDVARCVALKVPNNFDMNEFIQGSGCVSCIGVGNPGTGAHGSHAKEKRSVNSEEGDDGEKDEKGEEGEKRGKGEKGEEGEKEGREKGKGKHSYSPGSSRYRIVCEQSLENMRMLILVK